MTEQKMVWGGSWGTGGFGQRDSGHSGHSIHRHPNGQHIHTCSAHHMVFGGHGVFGTHYEEHCPGCRRERSLHPWGGAHKGNAALGLVSLFFGGRMVRKSLWD